MQSLLRAVIVAAAVLAGARADVETIVCFRHGEKTDAELGQLRPKGLNRALALPAVLIGKYGNPQYLFAPDPAKDLVGGKNGQPYRYYVRPLATIEPTAIYLGMPVNTAFGFKNIAGLETELLKPDYRNAVVFVCWEHLAEAEFTGKLIADLGGAGEDVPRWPSADYDSLYVIRITRTAAGTTATFIHDHEGLDSVRDTYPGPTATPASAGGQ